MASEGDPGGDVRNLNEVSGPSSPHYQAALHRYLIRCLRNTEDARDLAQEAYLRFLQLPPEREIDEPHAYLFRIAVNLVYELRRRREHRLISYDSELAEARANVAVDGGATDPSEELVAAEQLSRLLRQIPEGYRRVLILHKRDGLTYEEIANQLQISKQSVQKYLARAIAYGRRAKWDG
jgi:RNA polymerase sigma-19 factor, ECF subfamily